MATTNSHQLNNGLYVSGRPDQHKERAHSAMSSSAMPYTGGDVKKSGELGKMFDIATSSGRTVGRGISSPASKLFNGSTAPSPLAGSVPGQKSHSGHLKTSGQLKTSGPINLPATGLITSSGSSPAPSRKTSGLVSAPVAITNLSHDESYSFRKRLPRAILWTIVPLSVVGFFAGGFIMAAVKNALLLVLVSCLVTALLLLLVWNAWWGQKAVLTFSSAHPVGQLPGARDGQYVRVTGAVTCGSVPLESSYQKVSRCIYTSTSLCEYRGFRSNKPANQSHRRFSWGLRHLERHVVDFYISDFQSGLRALVKAGYGAAVTPCVEETTVVEVFPSSQDVPPGFSRWLMERNLSRDDRRMRLREGFIREGSTVTVLGVVQRNDNIVMLVPPPEPVSTGCQWSRLLLPATVQGLVVTSEETSLKVDVA